MVKKGYYRNEGLSLPWDQVKSVLVFGCKNKYLRLHHRKMYGTVPVVPFWLKKKMFKKKYCRNEGLGLAWNRVKSVLDAPIYNY